MNFFVEALQEMKNAALRQRMGEVQQSEEISSSQVSSTLGSIIRGSDVIVFVSYVFFLRLLAEVRKNPIVSPELHQNPKIRCKQEKGV